MIAPRIGSLCSGYRGLDMAVEQVFGGTTAWVSDIDPGANKILAHHWPEVPNLGDLTTTAWDQVEPVDIVCGGYPCQPFSTAGKRKGTSDERHIWPDIARALGVLRPRIAIFENVGGHLRLGFDIVLADLARLGFDVEWCVVRASEVGAPHPRRRLFIYATAADTAGDSRWLGNGDGGAAADATNLGHERGRRSRDGRPGPSDRSVPVADAASIGRGEGRPEPARQQGGLGPASGGAPDWGQFALAIRRWESVLGRPAPWATDDRNRLSPAFVEWLMGLPAGHVTDVPDLTRTQQLKALGNGVVPQQAAAALRLLADRAGLPQQLTRAA